MEVLFVLLLILLFWCREKLFTMPGTIIRNRRQFSGLLSQLIQANKDDICVKCYKNPKGITSTLAKKISDTYSILAIIIRNRKPFSDLLTQLINSDLLTQLMNLDNSTVCVKCHKKPGESYRFYSGEKISERSYVSYKPAQMVTTTVDLYSIGGSKEVLICDFCIYKYRRRELMRRFIIFFPILWSVFIIVWIVDKIRIPPLCVEPAGLANMGAKVGIKVYKHELRKQGYDCFWTPEEYEKLKNNSVDTGANDRLKV